MNSRYSDYLKHFRHTVTLAEFNAHPEKKNLVALRHDVDYDIDVALEMSCWEYKNDIRATYFVLPNSAYWKHPDLLDKCLQIIDFGHEIGLHVNIIAEWLKGIIDNPAQGLRQQLTFLRSVGIKITGVAAHGDPICYSKNFINYWIFKELRPPHPEQSESGLSAEGVTSTGDRDHITYPRDHALIRDNGDRLSLWAISMKQLNIDYHAVHIPHDRYYTDSGGEWKRSPDPLDVDLTRGRHQVLIHPEYWRGEQRLFFFLSTARSGSKWLSVVLDKASSLTSRHEFMLNHRLIDGKIVKDKRTADGFTDLQHNPDEALDLLLEVRPWVEELCRDYAEVNVYLERFFHELRKVYPEAIMIHLHRQPCDVVRSILNRDWYDTPEDNRHPGFAVEGWYELTPFQRACWYVGIVNADLIKHCSKRLEFRAMVSDSSGLSCFLNALEIAFYPRLAASFYQKRINASNRNDFPGYREWSPEQKSYYHNTCDIVNKVLGYPTRNPFADIFRKFNFFFKKAWSDVFKSDDSVIDKENEHMPIALKVDLSAAVSSPGSAMNWDDGLLTMTPEDGRNAYILFGGGTWYAIDKKCGWKAQMAHYYRGSMEVMIPDEGKGTARLICLLYDENWKISGQRPLVRLRKNKTGYVFSFRPGSAASRFNLALYMPVDDLPEKIMVKSLGLEMLPLGCETVHPGS